MANKEIKIMANKEIKITVNEGIIGSVPKLEFYATPTLHPFEILDILTIFQRNVIGQLMAQLMKERGIALPDSVIDKLNKG